MKARLFSKWGDMAGLAFSIGEEASIGRRRSNDVLLDHGAVSGRHARIYFDSERGAYFLEDLQSLNGTELDGRRVRRPERLGRLHMVNFAGGCEFVFQELDRSAVAETAEAPAAARPAGSSTVVDEQLPTLPVALGGARDAGRDAGADGTRVEQDPVRLPEILAGQQAAMKRAAPGSAAGASAFILTFAMEAGPMVFRLREGGNLVGRGVRSQITIGSMELSRVHATLTVEGDRVRVRDEGSRNRTFVNEEEVRGEVEIEPGGHLRFGSVEARLDRRAPEAAPSEEKAPE